MIRVVFLVAALAALNGCTPKTQVEPAAGQGSVSKGSTPEEEAPTLDILGGCKADALQRHIGKPFSEALAAELKKEAGAQRLRSAHENGMITMDYNSGRLNIFYNDARKIVRIDCG